MCLILCPEAGQFHAEQIGKRRQPDSVDPTVAPQFRSCLGVFRSHLLAREDHVHRPAGRRCAFLHEHVDSGYMPVLQSERLDGSGYGFQILAANDDIDVFG